MPTLEEMEKRCSALERKFRDIVIGGIILALAAVLFLGYTWKSIPEKVQQSLQGTAVKEAENQAIAAAENALAQSQVAANVAALLVAHEKNAKQIIEALEKKESTRINNALAVLNAQPKFMWKKGNNGTVTCNTYCGDSKWEGFAGTCVSAAINANDAASCDVAYGGATHCLCSMR